MASTREIAEELITCPYNKAHRIMRKRLQRHLIKCRTSHPDVKLVRCPFNSVHQVPEPELNHHVSICVDRASIDQYRFNVATVATRVSEKVPVSKQVEVTCDDDWDDVNVKSYNPKKYVENAPIIRPRTMDNLVKRETEDDDEEEGEYRGSPPKKRTRHLDDLRSDDED